MSLATKWVQFETIIFIEISQFQNDTYHVFSPIYDKSIISVGTDILNSDYCLSSLSIHLRNGGLSTCYLLSYLVKD